MYPMLFSSSSSRTLIFFLVLFCPGLARLAAAEVAPTFLYSRYFNAKGETRYLPDGSYKDVLDRLRGSFTVRVDDQPLNVANLQDIAVVLIANPSDKAVGNNPPPHHC